MKKERYFKDYEEFREFYFSIEGRVIKNVKNFKYFKFESLNNNAIFCGITALILENGELCVKYIEEEDLTKNIIAYVTLKWRRYNEK